MSVLSTGSPDPDDPQPTPDEPLAPPPFGSDPRPGNTGRAGEGPVDTKPEPLDEAADESFPASDPPAWSAAATTGAAVEPPLPAGRRVGLGRVVQDESAPDR
jgi:hypothetical protein